MKKLFYILPAAALVMMSGCSDDEPTPEPAPEPEVPENPVPEREPSDEDIVYPDGREKHCEIVLNKNERDVAKQSTKFAFSLLEAVRAEGNVDNALISPLSASIALSMAANGAVGDTQTEILDVLGFSGLDIADVNSFNKKMMSELPIADKNTKLSLANSLWVDRQFRISDTFKSALEEWYGSEYYTLKPSTFITNINKWCFNKTYGEIENFLPENAQYSLFHIINATYFKSMWSSYCKFEKEKTAKADFHNADGTVTKSDFMNQENELRFMFTESTMTCALFFGNNSYMLYLTLPEEGVGVDTALKELKNDWGSMNDLFRYQNVALSLPKFDVGCKQEIKSALISLGMTKSFSFGDFSAISPDIDNLGSVEQQTKFRIDEDGVTASAVTDISDPTISIPGEDETAIMTFDRPFIYTIAERSTGVILFVGVIDKL